MNQLVDRRNRLVFPYRDMVIDDDFKTLKDALNEPYLLSYDIEISADISEYPSANGFTSYQTHAQFLIVSFECSSDAGVLQLAIALICDAVNGYTRIERA